MTKENLKIAVLREEFSMITSHPIQALALNQFVYWENRTKDAELFREEERQRFINDIHSKQDSTYEGRTNNDPKYGWIYKTAKELGKEMLLAAHETTIRRHLNSLEEKGYLFRRPNPRYKWDKTYQYRVNLVKIVKDLEGLGYPNKDYRWLTSEEDDKNVLEDQDNSLYEENAGSSMQNGDSKMLDADAIPEITPKLTSIQNDEEESRLNFQVLEKTTNVIAENFKGLSGKKYLSNTDVEGIFFVAEQNWPIELVLQWMTECFKQFTPRHPKDYIRSFKYVENYLFDQAYHAGLFKSEKNQEVTKGDKQSKKLGRDTKKTSVPNLYKQLRDQLSETDQWQTELECDF
jgi:hypothetical protein